MPQIKNVMRKRLIVLRPKSIVSILFISMILTIYPDTVLGFQNIQQQTSFKEYKGEILNKDTKKALVFATLSIENTNVSTVSNTEGEFALKVPNTIAEGNVIISFLGYRTQTIALAQFTKDYNKIYLEESPFELTGVDLNAPKDARALVIETLKKKGENYFDDPTLMTAFYRETIKRRRKNVSLSEAVVNIYKTPYDSKSKDAMQLYKARKSTDYSRLDTVALKLQGGPYNALLVDIMKYPEYIFTEGTIKDYDFSFERTTRENERLLYVIGFEQKATVAEPMYKGKLYIDADMQILKSAVYSLNITDKDIASKMFVRKKPRNANVYPTEVAYRVDYREKNGKWYYGYSNVLLEFKINWDKKLFNSVYSMTCEMAVTDWEKNLAGKLPKSKERIKTSIILSDEALGFSDPDFWGEFNIIEPEKSIESAIRKIQRQLKKAKDSGSASKP